MNDSLSSDKRWRRILEEFERQRRHEANHTPGERARLLGAFLQACLNNLGRSAADFAHALNIDPVLADGLLQGMLPLSEIDDEFLAAIAHAVDHEPDVLRAIAGRTIISIHHEADTE